MTDAAFWTKRARKYAASPISNMPAYEKTLERVRAHFKTTDTAVEFGCGTGSTALLLAPSVSRYIGCDLSDGMIEIAREKLAASPVEGLSFDICDAHHAPAVGSQVDVVLAFNLYHLVPDYPAAFEVVSGMLKPGGLFITKTPCIAGKLHIRFMVALMRKLGMAPFVHFLRVEDYDSAIRAAGFEIVETGIYPVSPKSRFVVARKPE
jgi:ubiquinone/menaquinone biosynthesis C-methylase UbiE